MRNQLLITILLFACFNAWGEPPSNSEIMDALKAKVTTIQKIAAKPIIVDATKQQNAQNLNLDQIQKMDQEWMSSKALSPLKASMYESPAGAYLKNLVLASQGQYNEAFLTDNKGANVAAYPITTDYWQGDEEKFSQSFGSGQGQVYISPVKYDESSQTNAAQISVPVLDEKNQSIGVLIVGISLTHAQMLVEIKKKK